MFSSASRYGIRAVLFLAVNSSVKRKYISTELAEQIDVKKPYLSKILQALAKENIISSIKGPSGGFYLDRKNKQKNLMQILNCFDDLDTFNTCVLGLDECSNEHPCPLHFQAFAYREGMKYQFTHLTIADLAKKVKQLELKI